MVHARVSGEYIRFALMVNQDIKPNLPQKLAIGKKPSVSKLLVVLFPCVVLKATAYVDTKALNMRHWSQKGFQGIFVVIPQHPKGYLV